MSYQNIQPWKVFTKPEIAQICQELQIPSEQEVHFLCQDIHDNLQEHGVPVPEECSELLDTYLLSCGYITQEGHVRDMSEISIRKLVPMDESYETVLGEDDGYTQDVKVQETDTTIIVNEVTFPKPPCYTFADDYDPACRKCSVYAHCAVARIQSRPSCFGNYEATDPECESCLEKLNCKLSKEKR